MFFRLGRLLPQTRHLASPLIGIIAGSLTAVGAAVSTVVYVNPTLHKHVANKFNTNSYLEEQVSFDQETTVQQTVESTDKEEWTNDTTTDTTKRIDDLRARVYDYSKMCVDSSKAAIERMSEYSGNVRRLLSDYDNVNTLLDDISKLEGCPTRVEEEIKQTITLINNDLEEACSLRGEDDKQWRRLRHLRSNLRRCRRNLENMDKLVRTAKEKYTADRLLVDSLREYIHSFLGDVEALEGDLQMVYMHKRAEELKEENERLVQDEKKTTESLLAKQKTELGEESERIIENTRELLDKRVAWTVELARDDLTGRMNNEIESAINKYVKQRRKEDSSVLQRQRMDYAGSVVNEDRLRAVEDMRQFNSRGCIKVASLRDVDNWYVIFTGDTIYKRAVDLWNKCNVVSDLLNRRDVSQEEMRDSVTGLFECASNIECSRLLLSSFDSPKDYFAQVACLGKLEDDFRSSWARLGLLRFVQSLMTFDVDQARSGERLRGRDGQRVMKGGGVTEWNDWCAKHLELKQVVNVLKKLCTVIIGDCL